MVASLFGDCTTSIAPQPAMAYIDSTNIYD